MNLLKRIFFFFFIFIFHLTFNINHCSCQWSVQTFPFSGVIYGIAFNDVNHGVACGHDFTNFAEHLYYTTNSGTNWILASYPASIRSLPSVQYINATTLYASGAENISSVIRSDNFSPDFQKLPFDLKSRLLRMGINGFFSDYKGVFIKSTNAGVSWVKISSFDTTTGYLEDIHFLNANTGFACVDSGNALNSSIYKTTNGGVNWMKIYLEPYIYLERIFFIDVNTGFSSGMYFQTTNGGLIFRTTNSGLNWTKKSFNSPSINEIRDICFLNASTGIAIAQGGSGTTTLKILKTTNTGVTWDSVSAFGNILPESINFVSGTGIALITGWFDSVGVYLDYTFKSTDYGNTWVKRKIFTSNSQLILSSLVDQNNWFIGGGDFTNPAVVLKSTNGGSIFVNRLETEIPEKYNLYQNYPNPFNPATKIKFEITNPPFTKGGEGGLVNLKIFDILGKEIQTLINEQLQPGTYEVTFDGINLPGGIYFYKLTAGNFSDTKKLILLK